MSDRKALLRAELERARHHVAGIPAWKRHVMGLAERAEAELLRADGKTLMIDKRLALYDPDETARRVIDFVGAPLRRTRPRWFKRLSVLDRPRRWWIYGGKTR